MTIQLDNSQPRRGTLFGLPSLSEPILKICRVCIVVLRYSYGVYNSCFTGLLYSPFLRGYKVSSTGNYAGKEGLKACLRTALQPIPKEEFRDFGRAEGLRIARGLSYDPVGMCLMSSMHFLATNEISQSSQILRINALYEALCGEQSYDGNDMHHYIDLLDGKAVEEPTVNYPHLLQSLQRFMAQGADDRLRRFILNDLEAGGHSITPALYTLVLCLDNHRTKGNGVLATARNLIATTFFHLNVTAISETYEDPEDLERSFYRVGDYILIFKNSLHIHAIAIQNRYAEISIMDPAAGLEKVPSSHRNQALQKLYNHYNYWGHTHFQILSLVKQN